MIFQETCYVSGHVLWRFCLFFLLWRWMVFTRHSALVGTPPAHDGRGMGLLESPLGLLESPLGLLESPLAYGVAWQDFLAGTLVANMHGDGVKSWNCVVMWLCGYSTRFGTFVIYIVAEVFRQAFELRALVANALPSLPWIQARLELINTPTQFNIKTK
ncbi:uncharacterized protein EKO05_0003092 [Ascochyta rabiei]|uniref:uncharacterized protein n=1 Tax=Didymella rabiei TaxID=5454 RepID=UPI0022003450|nr:uncharacterized protein EKO05_0003092 [Ascochyta rabiei]UPX12547.1 hypothetical protein EKO05_0003092 [Ascochyta rabiei]